MATVSNACNLAVSADVTGLLGLYMYAGDFLFLTEASNIIKITSQDGCNLSITSTTPSNLVLAF